MILKHFCLISLYKMNTDSGVKGRSKRQRKLNCTIESKEIQAQDFNKLGRAKICIPCFHSKKNHQNITEVP